MDWYFNTTGFLEFNIANDINLIHCNSGINLCYKFLENSIALTNMKSK